MNHKPVGKEVFSMSKRSPVDDEIINGERVFSVDHHLWLTWYAKTREGNLGPFTCEVEAREALAMHVARAKVQDKNRSRWPR